MFGRRDERVEYRDSDVGAVYGDSTAAAETPQSLGGAMLGGVLPEARLLKMIGPRRLILILAGTAILAVGLLLAISWMNGKDSKAAQRGAAKFATALVAAKPSVAPDGAASYISGARSYFGPVTSAKIIGGHERGVNSQDTADERTYYVVEMLIQSKRGPAALELDFDDGAIGSDRISGIHELKPSDARGLSDAQRAELSKAFAARGGKAADVVKLSGVAAGAGIAAPSVAKSTHQAKPALHIAKPVIPASASHRLDKATKQLSCVQRAHGDVAKLQACTQ
ncbi:MAG TPA: hypothetical protein VGF74_13085 [Thermoleophilaceae bacterium]